MTYTVTVENGTKPANANSYISLADAQTYHASVGNTVWTDNTDDESKKLALILATQSVDLLYGERYMSSIYPDSAQTLLFPRMWFVDANSRIVKENAIPAALTNAVCELALMQISGDDLYPQKSTSNTVKNSKVKVGDIETSTEYFKAAEGETFSGFRKIDIILRPILKSALTSGWSLKA